MAISLLLPTRKRPQSFERMVRSAHLTAAEPSQIEVCVYIDDDDTESLDEANELAKEFHVKAVVGPRITLSSTWNKAYAVAAGYLYMHAGDDIVFRTPNWDTIVKHEFNLHPDKILFAFGFDMCVQPPGTFGTHGFIHRNWVEAVGYFVPPYFSSDYNDTWLNDVAKRIGRWKLVKILTEHLHPIRSDVDVVLDTTHKERILRHKQDDVDALYKRLEPERANDAQKLLNFIKSRA